MPKTTPQPPSPSGLTARLRRLRAEVDWMMLFPAFVALAWIFGEQAVAMVLVVVLPVFLALQGRPGAAPTGATPPATNARRPMARTALQAFIDEVLVDCAARDKTTAVLQVRLENVHVPDGDWGDDLSSKVLDRVVQRIAATLRGQDAIIRSGDRLLTVVLQPTNRADLEVVMNIIDRLQAAVAEPISLEGRSLRVGSVVGFCTEAAAPARSGAAMLSAAECALEAAGRSGEDAVRAFTGDLQAQIETDHQLGTQVERALDEGQIIPWFQPQIDAKTGQIAGVEALTRWDHPDLGLLPYDTFLPAVAAAGRVADMGETIFRAGLDALAAWQKQGVVVPQLCVNLSLDELRDPRLADRLVWQVDQAGLSPERVAFELSEALANRDDDETLVRNVHALRDAGFRLDLDNFGTGRASIAHVARFRVTRVKLDHSLVHDIDSDPARQRVVQAVLSLADTLDIDTLAQGVETEAERRKLAEMGVSKVQGFGVVQPMSAEGTLTWAQTYQSRHGSVLRDMDPRGSA